MSAPHIAQRLWLLARTTAGGPAEFAGAVAVLDGPRVYAVVLISDDANRANACGVFDCEDRARLERNALKFASLDDALEGLERIKQQFISRGWRDVECESGRASSVRRKETR